MKYAPIGTIGARAGSETLLEDLAYTLRMWLARDTDKERKAQVNLTLAKYEKAKAAVIDPDLSEFEDDLTGLFDLYCAPYASFGEREGEYGIYPDMESLTEDAKEGTVLSLDAGEDWDGRSTSYDYVMEVNDHGNVSLYGVRPKRLLWDCV